jgi:hypothetical protein
VEDVQKESLAIQVAVLAARFEESGKAVSAALAAQQRETAAAFVSSEKAITKAEANALRWQENANEWRGAMQDREKTFANGAETTKEFISIRAEIQGLRESRAQGIGKGAGIHLVWGVALALFGIYMALR